MQRLCFRANRASFMGICAAWMLAWTTPTAAQPQPPPASTKPSPPAKADPNAAPAWLASATGVLGLGPLMGVTLFGVRRQHIYHRDTNPLWDGLYLQGGVGAGTSFFTNSASVHVEVQPIAIFRLRLQLESWRWLGLPSAIGTGVPIASVDTPADPETLRGRKDETIITSGHRALLVSTLRAKVGPVAMLNITRLSGWYLPQGEGYLYDSEGDNLIARGRPDWNVANRLSLLWVAPRVGGVHALMVGPVHSYYRSGDAGITRHRLGGAVICNPFQRWAGLWEPLILLEVGTNLRDRHREGELYFFSLFQLGFAGREG